MTHCDICRTAIIEPIYTSRGNASMTTMLQVYEQPTTVWFCDQCGHLQTSEIVSCEEYYAHQYSILATTDDEDMLYKVVAGRPVFQVEHRVATLQRKIAIPRGANVLDFGCAKGSVLQQLTLERPDIVPHYYDVTERYVPFWQKFACPEQWCTGSLPAAWREQMDLVCSFYVLEHVADPVATVREMASLLRPEGIMYFLVPNVLFNTADLIVADHLQHYCESSLAEVLTRSGLEVVDIDDQSHEAAYIAIGRKTLAVNSPMHLESKQELRRRYAEMSQYWSELSARIAEFEKNQARNRPACIYGAGFYGNFVASCLEEPELVTCFVDQNPHLRGRTMQGRPIVAPSELASDIEVMYVGLNPNLARTVIDKIPCWQQRRFDAFYL